MRLPFRRTPSAPDAPPGQDGPPGGKERRRWFGWARRRGRGARGGRSQLAVRDLVDEALAGVAARPTRLVLTTLGTVLGVAALVATVGLGQTAAGQISGTFDKAAATRVVLEPRERDSADGQQQIPVAPLPWDAPARVGRLAGVAAAGTVSPVETGGDLTRSVPLVDPGGSGEHDLPLLAGSAGLFDAVHARLSAGRFFDRDHDRRADPVVLLGRYAARQLGITRVDNQPAIFVGDRAFTVIGLIEEVSAKAALLDSIVLPNGTARELYGLKHPATLEIRTDLGAAQLIGRQAPIAINPNQPDAISTDAPPPPSRVRGDVTADVNALFLILGAVALVVGGLGIANVTLLSVLERVGEIGLRRALGGTRRHVAAQFLLESVLMGLLGGLVGTSVGVLVTVAVSGVRDWTPLLDIRLAMLAPLLGAAIGLLAGTYPAWKASAIEPITALRTGT